MRNKINIKYDNNYTIAEKLFDEVIVWSAQKRPPQDFPSFIHTIEIVLNDVYKKGMQEFSS